MSRSVVTRRTQKPLFDRLIEVDQVFRKAAQQIAAEQAVVLITIELVVLDPTSKEPKAGASHLSMQFHGPLCKAWSERKPVTQDVDFQKGLRATRERILSPVIQLNVRFSSHCSTESPHFRAGSGSHVKWDATEFTFDNFFESDAVWKCSAEFEPKTNNMLWLSVSYDPDKTPSATRRLFEYATEVQELRLVSMAGAAAHLASF